MIDKKEVEKLAALSRIKMGEKEAKGIAKDLESVLGYIKKMEDVDTRDVEPLFHFPELGNMVREDIPRPVDRDTQKAMMRMGKDKDDYLRVQSIL